MSSIAGTGNTKAPHAANTDGYWRSLNDLRRLAGEITAGDNSLLEDRASGLNRRYFLSLLAASLSAAGVGCGRMEDRGEITGYTTALEGMVPGLSRFYASSLPHYPNAPAVIVTTREGRPIKLEGNPEHPGSCGALGAFGQAATLDLYDPDRLRTPMLGGKEISWEEADRTVLEALEAAGRSGEGILLVTPALVSPSARSLVQLFLAEHPGATHLSLELFHEGEKISGRKRLFGAPSIGFVRWDLADVVLSVDCDFLGAEARTADERGFADRRDPDAKPGMNRLWSIEGAMTVTGANADHRFAVRPAHQAGVLLRLFDEIARKRGLGPLASDARLTDALGKAIAGLRSAQHGLDDRGLKALAEDLVSRPGRGAVLVGRHLPSACHVLAGAINLLLGNEGTAVESHRVPAGAEPSSPSDWSAAVRRMSAGRTEVVLCLQANPLYLLPPDSGFEKALETVPLLVCSSLLRDETASKANLLLPAAHDLECWGDSDSHPGVLTLQQPTIQPLFKARQDEETLLHWLAPDKRPAASYAEYVKGRWKTEVHPRNKIAVEFEPFWEASLHEGFILEETSPLPAAPARIDEVVIALGECARLGDHGLDVVLTPGLRTFDGRFANNGWLQELPHPLTTQVWGNSAVVSAGTAKSIDCLDGGCVRLRMGGRTVVLPVLVGPGVADGAISVEMGYGRRAAGSVGTQVGVDVGTLRTLAGGLSSWLYLGAEASAEPDNGRVVRVQEHHVTEGRQMVRELTWDEYRRGPAWRQGSHGQIEHMHTWEYKGHKWAMAIDLSACTGCGACTIACVAENNIPVVGPEEVARGREMHWIRIDRYYKGAVERPTVAHQPMPCQHCDYAPCEKVCPVAATVHSPEGLDEMVYNRCVGTRYCANNCPYKVRRFNFFDYHQEVREPTELAYNPEVTVRSRGVMEKCTFCVQRISAAKQAAKAEGRKPTDQDLQTACQQACPSRAIVFGDVNSTDSAVHRLAESPRGYQALGELGIYPAVTYLAKVRNPYPGLKV